MELVLQAAHSAQSMGYACTELNLVEVNMTNNPPTMTVEKPATDDMPPVRFISIL
jgi:hypothetical protein